MLLLVVFAARIEQERTVWVDATRVRDVLLTEAGRLSQQMSCRSLEVHASPDAERGVFVFRQGLSEALAPLTNQSGTEACILRWTGSGLAPVAAP